MFQTSILHINRHALVNNLEFIKKTIGNKPRMSSVIKGNAYGHGIEVFVPLAESCGVDHFAVFNADEALRAHKSIKRNSDIMIMGMIDNLELEWAIENRIEFFVFEFDRLFAAIEKAKEMGKKARIHVELETGMNRTGFDESEMEQLINVLKANRKHFEFVGLVTHLAGAESIANYTRITSQIKRYKAYYKRFKRHGLKPKYRHIASSAASVTYPDTRLDMVRIGILQYGFWPSPETFINYTVKNETNIDPLQRVLSWKSRVMSTKYVNTGEFIGYGTSYIAKNNMKIACIPVGYAHGYSRSLSHQGRVLINGQRVDIVGVVNMNMLIVKISDIPETKKGDEVVLIGHQNGSEITVASFSDFSNQLNYEMLTRLPKEIPRIVEF
ncbi:MAG: alanine racemase [Bacteroidales bacterium]|jgi:alanine racemase|nr:alanine racemase [Bacteroidales bacterium]